MKLEQFNDLLSVKDLMKLFGVSKNTIYKEIQSGKFGNPIQIGRTYRVPKTYIYDTFFANYN